MPNCNSSATPKSAITQRPRIRDIDTLLRDRGKPVSCLSRHIFAGTTAQNRPGDALHSQHMDALKRVIDMAHVVGSPLVRIMTQKKEQILWGSGGAEKWNVAHGAWDTMAPMIAPAVDLARASDITLVVETGNGTMVNSNYTARRLIDELGAQGCAQGAVGPGQTIAGATNGRSPMAMTRSRTAIWGTSTSRTCRSTRPAPRSRCANWATGNWARCSSPWPMPLRADGYAGVIFIRKRLSPRQWRFRSGVPRLHRQIQNRSLGRDGAACCTMARAPLGSGNHKTGARHDHSFASRS